MPVLSIGQLPLKMKELILSLKRKKEAVILGAIFFLASINFLHIILFFEANRYLPPPFFYSPTDTFMDFYNTLYWSGREGIYDVWGSIYPPLNFIFLKTYEFLFIEKIPRTWDGFAIRESGISNIVPLLLLYIISLMIAVRISFKHIVSLQVQIILFVIFLISPAFLFALERGNIIILCIPFLSWYIFSNNQISRAIALSILVNLKPYLAVIYLFELINQKSQEDSKDFLILMPIFALILFLFSGLLINEQFFLIPFNLLGFASGSVRFASADILSFPSTINAFGHFRGLVIEFRIPPFIGILCKLAVFIYILKTLIIFFRFKVNTQDLTIFAIIFLTNYSTSTGGYGVLYYIPIIALLYLQKCYALVNLIAVCLFLGIWDIAPFYRFSTDDDAMTSYLSGEVVYPNFYISLGSVIRPIANFALLVMFYNNLRKKFIDAGI